MPVKNLPGAGPALQPVCLALGGGAALGWAHIGVAQVLAERGLPIAAVAGTSIGAVVAACIADDKLAELEQLARSANAFTVMRYLDVSVRGGGMLGGRMIEQELKRYFGTRLIEHLRIPCATVAADLMTGNEIVLRTGSVAQAVRASLAIPGIFTPVVKDGMVLTDGGIINPVPVSVVRALSSAPVIAVQLFGNYPARARAIGIGKAAAGKRPNMISISRISVNLLVSALTEARFIADPPDILITPDIGHVDVGDFTKADILIKAGRQAAIAAWPSIATIAAYHPDKPKQ